METFCAIDFMTEIIQWRYAYLVCC